MKVSEREIVEMVADPEFLEMTWEQFRERFQEADEDFAELQLSLWHMAHIAKAALAGKSVPKEHAPALDRWRKWNIERKAKRSRK